MARGLKAQDLAGGEPTELVVGGGAEQGPLRSCCY